MQRTLAVAFRCCLMVAGVVIAQEKFAGGIVYGPRAAFNISAPEGWVLDNESGKETSFTQKFTVQPQRFAMLPPQFYSDQEGKNPAPNGGHVGQVVYFRGWVVGLENSKGVDFEIGAEVRDSSAQKVLWKSRKKEIKESDPEKTKEAVGNLGGPIPLTTPGNYILRTFAIDHLARKSVCCDFPLHIEAPGKGMRYEGESKELPYEALLPPAVSAIPPPLPPEVIQVSSPPK